jgi:hypothetical protein
MDNLKLKLLSLIGLISFTIHVYGQCDKTGNLFGIPDEFVINRYSPPDKIYGHPYTIFNKRDYGAESFNLELEVDEIRRRIGSWGTVNHPSGWKKNHGIIAASAIGMAAIVLNDAGVETNFITGL